MSYCFCFSDILKLIDKALAQPMPLMCPVSVYLHFESGTETLLYGCCGNSIPFQPSSSVGPEYHESQTKQANGRVEWRFRNNFK